MGIYNLGNVRKRRLVAAGEVVELKNTGNRRVDLDCLFAPETELRVFFHDGNEKQGDIYIGTFEGVCDIAFQADCAVDLAATADFYLYVRENEKVTYSASDDRVSFVRMLEKRERDPHLEKIMHTMETNLLYRLQLQQDEMMRQQEDRQNRLLKRAASSDTVQKSDVKSDDKKKEDKKEDEDDNAAPKGASQKQTQKSSSGSETA